MKSNIALLWNYILPKQCLTRASYACDSYKYTMNTIVKNPQKTYADQFDYAPIKSVIFKEKYSNFPQIWSRS